MKAFDNREFEKYKTEVKERWGETEAYKEFYEKSKGCTKEKYNALTDGMNGIFAEFSVCMKSGAEPDSEDAQNLVKKLQSYITENFYTCTREILSGLGQMYILDERFRNNIDKHTEGTAQFVNNAIKIYC